MITAKEATELTQKFKVGFSALEDRIKAMAEAGNDYATIETKRLKDPEGYATQLREIGYTVQVGETYFSITWPKENAADDLPDSLYTKS